MPKGYQNRHGQLVPVTGERPAGNGSGNAGAQPVPVPTPSRPENLRPMYPAGYYTSNLLAYLRGRPYWLNARDYPVVVPAGGTASTLIQTDTSFAQFVLAATVVMRATEGVNAGVDDLRYGIDVRRRNMALQDQTDTGFLPIQSVFGSGRYPHWFKMPMLLMANSTFIFELRSRVPGVPVSVQMLFLVDREKNKGRA